MYISFCKSIPNAAEDYPFKDQKLYILTAFFLISALQPVNYLNTSGQVIAQENIICYKNKSVNTLESNPLSGNTQVNAKEKVVWWWFLTPLISHTNRFHMLDWVLKNIVYCMETKEIVLFKYGLDYLIQIHTFMYPCPCTVINLLYQQINTLSSLD